MTTLDTRRPGDLARKRPAHIVPVETAGRPLRGPDGRFLAVRGGPSAGGMLLLVVTVLLAAGFAGFLISLMQQS